MIFTPNTRGQLWSLDVVLAAVIFTLALGIVLSQAELQIFYTQQEKNAHSLELLAWRASNALSSKPEIILNNNKNVRCGPDRWQTENDLSWMENCIRRWTNDMDSSELGLPPEYGVQVTVADGSLRYGPPNIPSNIPFYSITRRMLVLPQNPSPNLLHDCLHLQPNCANRMDDVSLTVWRNP